MLFSARHLVVRQFQHERRRRVVAPHEELDQERHAERAGDARRIKAEHHQAAQIDPAPNLRVGDEGGNDQRVDRDPRRAGHQRRDQDGGQPVAAIVDHPRRHDAGDRAGETRQQRNEGAAVQAGAAHDAVHQERRARHVAEIFQQQDEQEDDDDLRQEHDDAADAGNHAVLKKTLQDTRGQRVVNQLAERAECRRQATPSAAAPMRTPPGTSRTGSAPGSRAPPPGAAPRRRSARSRYPAAPAG